MLLKYTSPFAKRFLFNKGLPVAHFSNNIKDKLENFIKSEPKVILQDAAQSQAAIV